MTVINGAGSWRDWARRHEQSIAGWYLAAVALLCAVFVVPFTRHVILGKLEGAAVRVDLRWDARVAEGQRLVAAGQYPDAIRYLEHLDQVFPAPSEQHARDKQREQILRLLAASYEGARQYDTALATWDRLIKYEPRDYTNLYLRAAAAERIAVADSAETPIDVRNGWLATLRLFPSHYPSVRGAMRSFAAKGDVTGEAAVYRAYLDAFLVEHIALQVGSARSNPGVLLDGAPHAIDMDVSGNTADTLSILTHGFAFMLDSIELLPASGVGRAPAPPIRIPTAAAAPVRLTRAAHGAWLPSDDSAALHVPLVWHGDGRIRLVIRLYKPVDAATWGALAGRWRSDARVPGLADTDARSVPFATAKAADHVLARVVWSEPVGFDSVVTR